MTRARRALLAATLAVGLTAGVAAPVVEAAPRDLDCSYWDIINWQCGWREGYTGFLGGRPPRILVHGVPKFVASWLGLHWGPLYGSWVRDRFVWER